MNNKAIKIIFNLYKENKITANEAIELVAAITGETAYTTQGPTPYIPQWTLYPPIDGLGTMPSIGNEPRFYFNGNSENITTTDKTN